MKNNSIVPGFDDEKDKHLKIQLQKIDRRAGCLVLYLNGHFGVQSTQLFQKRLAKAIEWGYVRLIFHFAKMDFRWPDDDELREAITDFIGSLAAFIKAVKPRGGAVVLIEVPPDFYELLQLIGFEDYFNIKENLKEAVSFFAQ